MRTRDRGRPGEVPAFLQLAGHPVRWRLLSELGRSDRTVQELTALVGQPQNLVSYHLGKLRAAHVVTARRSSADRRGSYYRLDLARVRGLLAGTGTALHPGLLLGPPPPSSDDPAPSPGRAPGHDRPARVLFLCSGNSARSQMAEALARVRSGGRVEAHSAGRRPKPVHPLAVRVMREGYGIDISAQRAKAVDVYADQRFDQVVTVCDRVREACPELAGAPEATHWSMADPSAVDPSAGRAGDPSGGDGDAVHEAFRRTAAELDGRLEFLLAGLAGTTTFPTTDTSGAQP